jgi:hypothetical protein
MEISYNLTSIVTAPYICTMLAKDDLQQRWWDLEAKLVERFGKKPDMETILFLIGIQELGDIKRKFTKEQKQDLMHVAVCCVLMPSGYYEQVGVDDDGWPHFHQLKPMPDLNAFDQEIFLKDHVLLYFQNHEAMLKLSQEEE